VNSDIQRGKDIEKMLERFDRQRNIIEMVTQVPDIAGCADRIIYIRDGAVKVREGIRG
jgi:ABC-type lipoprotein export system ATPase subunit